MIGDSVLDGKPNPCLGVEPPGDRKSRQSRRKTFIYPREAFELLACKTLPLEWRETHALAAYLYLRPGELRVLTWADVDLAAMHVHVTKAWDYNAVETKEPKTRNGVRHVPIEPTLVPLLERLRKGKRPGELVAPVLEAFGEDHLAELFREHLTTAGVTRGDLHASTKTHVQSNFRSWRDSGLTWLAMSGLGVDKIMRRAGHDVLQTTMGYVKLAEDLTGDLGVPFGELPASLVSPDEPDGGTPTDSLRRSERSAEQRRDVASDGSDESCVSKDDDCGTVVECPLHRTHLDTVNGHASRGRMRVEVRELPCERIDPLRGSRPLERGMLFDHSGPTFLVETGRGDESDVVHGAPFCQATPPCARWKAPQETSLRRCEPPVNGEPSDPVSVSKDSAFQQAIEREKGFEPSTSTLASVGNRVSDRYWL